MQYGAEYTVPLSRTYVEGRAEEVLVQNTTIMQPLQPHGATRRLHTALLSLICVDAADGAVILGTVEAIGVEVAVAVAVICTTVAVVLCMRGTRAEGVHQRVPGTIGSITELRQMFPAGRGGTGRVTKLPA